jgi:RHS repeat-associated protein
MEGTNEVGDWQWQKDHAYRGDTLVMAWTPEPYPEDRHYYSVDHLGTPRLVTDAAGNVESVHHYFGFGEELSTTSTAETKRFTGHERDFHTPGSRDDLDYLHARYYKAHMGRFLTVDPVGGRPEVPGSWNRYAYVENNPTNLTDPTGLVAGPATLLLTTFAEICAVRGLCSNEIIYVVSTPRPLLDSGFGRLMSERVQRFPKEFSIELGSALYHFFFDEPDRFFCLELNGELDCGEMKLGMAPNPFGPGSELGKKTVRELISGRLKRFSSYREELADLTLDELTSLARGKGPKARAARQMKKSVQESDRLTAKSRGKPR